MRKTLLALTLIVVSIDVWASPASAIGTAQTFSLLEINTANSDHPLGDFTFHRAPVGGDAFAVTNTLYKWHGTRRGARIGHDEVMITFITGFGSDFSRNATALFVAQLHIPGGSIIAQGYGQFRPDGPQHWTFPVLGGTGAYANVRGYVNVRDLGDGSQSKSNLELHLVP